MEKESKEVEMLFSGDDKKPGDEQPSQVESDNYSTTRPPPTKLKNGSSGEQVELIDIGSRASQPGNQQDQRGASPASADPDADDQQISSERALVQDEKQKEVNESSEGSNKEGTQKDEIAKLRQKNIDEETRLMRKFNGIFFVHDKKEPTVFSKSSLYCLSDNNFLRKGLVWIIEWKWFDRLITLAILLNSALLASTDFETRFDPEYESEWTPTQESIDRVFTWIFIIECVFKVIGMGFVIHKKSYLRDPWNNLDFFIVLVSVVDLLGVDSDSLKALRTFRILRPLRSINAMPTMRDLIQSLLGSIPGLLNTIFFLGFIFSIFAIFGTNQFLGKTNYFCRTGDPTYDDITGEFLFWTKAEADWLCATDADCERQTGDPLSRCGSVYDEAGVDPIKYDNVRNIELTMYGIPNFDNFGHSLVSIFQVLSLESWSYMMYNYSDSVGSGISVIFFLLVVILGAFFTMNLVLAQIMDSFERQEDAKAEALAEQQEEMRREMEYEEKLQKEKDVKAKQTGPKSGQIHDDPNTDQQVSDQLPQVNPSGMKKIVPVSAEQINASSEIKPESINGISEIRKSNERVDESEIQKNIKDLSASNPDGTLTSRIDDEDPEALFDEEEHEKDSRARSYNNCCYRFTYLMVTSVCFNFFIFCLIIANTVTLAIYTYDQSDFQEMLVDIFNELFTWIFLLEMVIKMIGLGFGNYIKDGYNLFDCVIVIISMVDWTITRIPSIDLGTALKALKALRLLRMMKLSKSWKALQDILDKSLASLKAIASFGLLLFLFMFIFALLGMELFAKKAVLDEEGELVLGMENVQALYTSGEVYGIPRVNFDNVGWSLVSIFIVIVGEDWNWQMYLWTRAYSFYDDPNEQSDSSYWICVMYFMLLMIMGNIILFSLFTAILLKNFEEDMQEKIAGGDGAQSSVEEEKKSISQKLISKDFWDDFYEGFSEAFGKKQRIKKEKKKEVLKSPEHSAIQLKANEKSANASQDGNPFALKPEELQRSIENGKTEEKPKKPISPPQDQRSHQLLHYDHRKLNKMSSIKEKVQEKVKLEGNSLCCFGPTNFIRTFCASIATAWIFEQIILVLIVTSTITLALETPLDNPDGELIQVLNKIDVFMTTSFTIEALLKIVTLGFACNGKNSYIRDAWNILDILIVASALLGIFAGDAIDISFLKALRILRILRPLRLASRIKGLRIAITSLFNSIPSIINLQIIVFFFLFLFAILQTTLFSGAFNRCHTDHLTLSPRQTGDLIVTQWDCLNLGGEWVKPDLNFDDTMRSMLALLTIQSTEGWIDVMWDSVDAVGPYQQPIENNNVYMAIYTMVIVIIICMLFLDLFVGVVIETYNRENQMLSYNQLLKSSQRTWIQVQLMTFEVKPVMRLDLQGNSWLRTKCILFVSHKAFDTAIMILIILNTVVLAFNWYMMPEYFVEPIEYINFFFVVIFTLEAVFKIFAMRLQYFKDSWNIFDFSVVILTIVILTLVKVMDVGKSFGMTSTILRTLRIGRVFRLVKKAKQLQIIFETLMSSAPAIGSLGLLLMLLMFMSSIIGVSQFALIGLDGAGEMNYHVNFQTFGTAFLTLMRCATGEAWNTIMFDSARGESILFQCEAEESYEAIIARGEDPALFSSPKGCGPTYVAYSFFILFQILVGQIFLNLFIAIIIEAFFGQNDLANLPLNDRAIEEFVTIWSRFDVHATGYLDVNQISNLLIELAKSEDGSEMVMFKNKIIEDEEFRARMIWMLEIPTFDNFKKVMFYDVMQCLINQVVKLHHNREKISENKAVLKVLRAMKMGSHDDTLQALNLANVKNDYDIDFDELLKSMRTANSKIELVNMINERSKKLHKTYNSIVDTTEKAKEQMEQKEAAQLSEVIQVYTTKHWMLAKYIVKQLRIVLSNKKKDDPIVGKQRGSLRPVTEADTNLEQTAQIRNSAAGNNFLPAISSKRGSNPEAMAEINRAEERAVNDNSEISVDENEFSEVVMDTAFHNDKKNLK